MVANRPIVTTGYNTAGYATTLPRASDGTVYGTIEAMDAWGMRRC